jgi:hypothetical protein
MIPAGVGRGAAGGYLRFLALAAAVALATAVLGVLPTRALGGPGAVSGLLAACAVSFVASAAGGVPLARSAGGAARVPAALAATAVRLLLVAVLGGALAVTGWVPRTPLLLWLALSYAAQLALDTWYAVR